MLDMTSYVIGYEKGKNTIIMDSTDYSFTDQDAGNIVIEASEEAE